MTQSTTDRDSWVSRLGWAAADTLFGFLLLVYMLGIVVLLFLPLWVNMLGVHGWPLVPFFVPPVVLLSYGIGHS